MMDKIAQLTSPYDDAAVECDGMTRVFYTVLLSEGIVCTPKVGILAQGTKAIPHFWIDLPDGRRIDYRARMWLGSSPDVPHGVFDPAQYPKVRYGADVRLDLEPLPSFLFEILTGRKLRHG